MTRPKALPSHLVETKWVIPREAQRKLFSAVCKGRTRVFLSQEVKQAFGGWDLTVLLLSVGKERQVKSRAHEGSPGESHQRFLLRFPLRCSERGAACGGSESAPLRILWIMALEVPFVTQTCTPCASLQHSHDYGSCSCLLCWIWGQIKCAYGWGWCKDVCQKRCYICEKVWDSMSARQIFTEDAAK